VVIHMPQSRYPRIEMVYDPDCPNVDLARTAIRGALTLIGAPLAWREWDCTDAATPDTMRVLGSPSVLVNGQDVGCGGGSMAQADANSCRIYRDGCGCICGAPSVELILKAISNIGASEETA
jgi:mercuric ion transport protein